MIQTETSKQFTAVTMVAPITSAVRLPLSPLHVLLPAGSSTGLAVPSVAVFNQFRAVDRRRLVKKLGVTDSLVMLQVDSAIRAAFGLAAAEPNLTAPVVTNEISDPAD